MISNIFNEGDLDVVIEEIVNIKHFEKSDGEKETYEKIEKLKIHQNYNDGVNNILDDLNEKEKNDPRVQPTFKR